MEVTGAKLKHDEEEDEYADDVDVGVEEPLVSPPPPNSPVYAVSERILDALPFRRGPKVWPFKRLSSVWVCCTSHSSPRKRAGAGRCFRRVLLFEYVAMEFVPRPLIR